MRHDFDETWWQQWRDGQASGSMAGNPPNPHLSHEIGSSAPGTALDAGCGAGAEAVWLAEHGWQVTAADISAEALARAAERSNAGGPAGSIRWTRADLTVWDPGTTFDLVTTHYAHPSRGGLDLGGGRHRTTGQHDLERRPCRRTAPDADRPRRTRGVTARRRRAGHPASLTQHRPSAIHPARPVDAVRPCPDLNRHGHHRPVLEEPP